MSKTLRSSKRQISRQPPSLFSTKNATASTSSSRSRRYPLLRRSISTPTWKSSFLSGRATAAELCGGTMASCAAVWCCCPCGIGKLLVLVIYKVPAGLCRRAVRYIRRKHIMKKGLLSPEPSDSDRIRRNRFKNPNFVVHPLENIDVSNDEDDDLLELKIFGKTAMETIMAATEAAEEDAAVINLEKEMWNRFYGAGFWRSFSQREIVSSPRISRSGSLLSRCHRLSSEECTGAHQIEAELK